MSNSAGSGKYRQDSALWRQQGVKALLAFLAEASEEQHNAIVYDTGYEFDPSDADAVRFIACAAMTKAAALNGNETFSYPMPSNGSVVPAGEAASCERFYRIAQARKIREDGAEFTYIPDQVEYVYCVLDALTNRHISCVDMTQEELRYSQQEDDYISKQNRRFMLLHYYLPIAAFVIFAIIGLGGLLHACSA